MPETTQTSDLIPVLDTTIHFLQQDLASADLALAVNYIEQWENLLQETGMFHELMELKQVILDGNLTALQKMLHKVGEDTAANANGIRENGSEAIAAKVAQIGQLLVQASQQIQ
ncbi:hypothetical protein [Leptolyngbya ohadii]|uniref:hypothetical protein n=1 Tax=Leptolyngbya ohadii TaxID=1962290 RepID=UPI000B59F9CA|nr:hypothetical protein [Leptolyngbya ohadii]